MKRTLFKTRLFRVEEEPFFKNSRKFNAFRISVRNSVVIVPVFDDGSILLERQYRYPIKKYLYELPAGRIKKGEKPSKTTARELEEETGYRARRIRYLFKSYTSPGLTTGMHYFFIATALEKSQRHLDADEIINVKRMSINRALSMIRNNSICDAKTIEGILYCAKFVQKTKS
ncbi:MAG: NUDIX hydrolase [Candidatus Micrarchaeaceae archaeon]